MYPSFPQNTPYEAYISVYVAIKQQTKMIFFSSLSSYFLFLALLSTMIQREVYIFQV
jgi:hypothetical protein